MTHYNNTVLTLVGQGTPDPFVTAFNGRYYLTFTAGDRIEIWASDSLVDFKGQSTSHVIWRPPPDTEHSDGLWAPELHAIGGKWYVYYAAGHPAHGNKSHRMFVLAGPSSNQEPTSGPWEFAGPVQGLPQHQWAIDGTAFELNGALYFVYSGWPFDNPGDSDLTQQLFIVRLNSPTQAASQPVMISKPEHRWEISTDQNGDHGINEGPQFLASPDKRWQGIIYSCAGSWTKDYKMGILHYRGGDPLNASSWQKDTKPLLQTAPGSQGPWGPGHGNFLHLGNDTVAVFHATDRPTDGWDNRKARVQRLIWTQHGPQMGGTVGPMVNDVNAFLKGDLSGQPSNTGHGVRAFLHDAKEKLREL